MSIAVFVSSNVSCNGDADDSVGASAFGGTGDIEYSIENVGTNLTGNFEELTATYTVTAVDENGCAASGSATVTQPTVLTVVIVDVGESECFPDYAAITVDAYSGVFPYEYSLDEETWFSSAQGLGASSGTYNVYVVTLMDV